MELYTADRREDMGPEIIGLQVERGVEFLDRCAPLLSVVPLLPGQEMIECRRRRESIGFTAFLLGSRLFAHAHQAGGAAQMIGPGRRPKSSRLVEDPQA